MLVGNALWGMRLIRLASALIEGGVALAMLRGQSPGDLLRLNSIPGLLGPFIFLGVSLLGIGAQLGEVRWDRLAMTITGAALIYFGTR